MKKIILFLFTLICFISVNKAIAQPVLQMDSVTDISYSSARFVGSCSSLGGWAVNGHGFIFDTIYPPSRITGAKIKQVSAAAPSLTNRFFTTTNPAIASEVLASGKTYYVRVYSKKSNPADTVYSDTLSFTTKMPIKPAIKALPATNITLTTAKLNGEITARNDAPSILAKGFVYDTLPDPKLIISRFVANTTAASTFPFSMSENINNLVSGKYYYYRTYCIFKYNNRLTNDTIYSDTIGFRVLHPCGMAPFDVIIDSITIKTAKVSWTKGIGQTKWEVDFEFAGHTPGNGIIVSSNYDSITLTELVGGRNYSVFVRSVCNDFYNYSDWSLTTTFSTLPPLCSPIYNIHANAIRHSSASISWSPGTMLQNKWEVLFVKSTQNFPDTGTIITNNPIFSPIGLQQTTQYKMKVRAICENGYNSDWSEEYRFSTNFSNLDDELENGIPPTKIFPNPTDGTINFQTENKNISKVEIWNNLGELIFYSDKLPQTYTLTNQAKGLFLIKIFTGEKVQIEKVILK